MELATLLIQVVGLYLIYLQLKIMRRSAPLPKPRKHVLLKQYWPILAMVVMLVLYSVPWFIDRFIPPPCIGPDSDCAYLESNAKEPVYPLPYIFADKPVRFDVPWLNVGKRAAVKTAPYCRVYFLPDAENLTQENMVRDFKAELDEYFKTNPIFDAPPFTPNSPPRVCTALGPSPNISQDEIDKVLSGKELVFIIGAVRFHDRSGEHEARTCSWFQSVASYSNGQNKLSWRDCVDYLSQVDLKSQ